MPLIAILRGIRPDEVLAHVVTLLETGFDAIEIPLNSPEWQSSIELTVKHCGQRAWIGGGTVLRTSDVDALESLGARLVVTPNCRAALIRHGANRGLVMVPGIATATEAFDALEAGAHALKIFPAGVYGPELVRALRAVLPAVPLFAVGGITPENLGSFLSAGCAGAGLGSQLYQPSQTVSRTRSMAKAYVQAFREGTA